MQELNALLSEAYFGNTLGQYAAFLGILIAGLIVARVSYYLFKTRLRKLAARSQSSVDDHMIDIIEEPLVLLIFTISFWLGTQTLTLNEAATHFFDNVVLVLMALTVTWLFLRLVDMLLDVYVSPLVSKSESRLDDAILPILRKTTKTAIVILAAILVLSNLGYNIWSVLAGLSIGSLAIALAAQDAVKNIIGGISIFWDKPFQIGDWVELSGKSGGISEVGLRSTRIKTVGGTTVVIPNSKVADTVIENFSTRDARRVALNIGLTYDTSAKDIEKAISLIEDVIKSESGTRDEDILSRFVNFGAFSLDLEIVYWITDMSDWKMIIHRINMGVKTKLDAAKIDMAFPTETHYVIEQK